jgi:hypothetical protein
MGAGAKEHVLISEVVVWAKDRDGWEHRAVDIGEDLHAPASKPSALVGSTPPESMAPVERLGPRERGAALK